MKTFTVIALHDDTASVVTCVQKAGDANEAMAITANEIYKRRDYQVQIICAIPGDLAVYPPCEDSGKAAYVADLSKQKEGQTHGR